MLWAQRKKRKATSETTEDKCPESHRPNDSWIKSHFSRLSEERLPTYRHVVSNSGHLPEGTQGEANTTLHVDTLTTKHGEGGVALHRDSFASKQKISGTSVIKEMQRESGKSPSMENETWAAVAACTKEIDAKGHHVANSMLQRSETYHRTGHEESRNISPEDLKALEEVELKLKGNFLTQRETTIAGGNQSHFVYNQSRHGNQSHHSHASHQNNQSRPVHHQGHNPNHLNHQGYPSYSSHQNHPGHSNHQGHPGLSSQQSHPSHSSQQGHPSHSSQQGHPGHSSLQSHCLLNRRNQIYDS